MQSFKITTVSAGLLISNFEQIHGILQNFFFFEHFAATKPPTQTEGLCFHLYAGTRDLSLLQAPRWVLGPTHTRAEWLLRYSALRAITLDLKPTTNPHLMPSLRMGDAYYNSVVPGLAYIRQNLDLIQGGHGGYWG